MKPIEPGCLVLVIGCENRTRYLGRVLVVEKMVRHGQTYKGHVVRSSSGESWACTNSDHEFGWSQHNPAHLVRIDGDESATTETREAETA